MPEDPILNSDDADVRAYDADEEPEYYEDDEFEEEAVSAPDPLVRWMTLMSLMLVIALLGATASIVFFLLNMRGAPRTAGEREIYIKEALVKDKKTDPNAWFELAYAYMNGGQFTDARTAISKGRKVQKLAAFDLAEADLERVAGNYDDAIKKYAVAEKSVTAELKRVEKEMAKKAVRMKPSPGLLIEVHVGRGMCYQKMNKSALALKEYEEVVKLDPTDSFAWVQVGDLRSSAGKSSQAKQAYQSALKYIPDYEPALAGLKKLETE